MSDINNEEIDMTEYDLQLEEITPESPTDFELIKELIHKIGTELNTDSMDSIWALREKLNEMVGK